ncbi:hypothetical protein [Paracoccus versutus]|uniref:Terminase small subunit n=1 Tax=Paracoccus versutus TaxID=34007 RepID=A0A3D9XIY0_PARVE|nr:hypothetical protein [Paracoccus versutus]REF70394.1 hypothetical protein BDD41_3126 [Paracoccus versutus]WGR57296.1 hypothetical protein E3U25_14940 [Paracoccus versutus]
MAYSADEIAKHKDGICEAIASGSSLLQHLRKKGMPGYTTVMKWLAADPDFQANYARAREAQADADADKIGDIVDRVLAGKLDPQAARAAIDALKWTAGKRQPKKYGDKLDLDINGRVQIERVEVKFVGDEE